MKNLVLKSHSIFLSLRFFQIFLPFCLQVSFMSSYLYANGIFPVLKHTHFMYADEYYTYIYSHSLKGSVLGNKISYNYPPINGYKYNF